MSSRSIPDPWEGTGLKHTKCKPQHHKLCSIAHARHERSTRTPQTDNERQPSRGSELRLHHTPRCPTACNPCMLRCTYSALLAVLCLLGSSSGRCPMKHENIVLFLRPGLLNCTHLCPVIAHMRPLSLVPGALRPVSYPGPVHPTKSDCGCSGEV